MYLHNIIHFVRIIISATVIIIITTIIMYGYIVLMAYAPALYVILYRYDTF